MRVGHAVKSAIQDTGRTQNSPLDSHTLSRQERKTLDNVRRSVCKLYTSNKLSAGGLAKFMQASKDNTIARQMIRAYNRTKTDPIIGMEISFSTSDTTTSSKQPSYSSVIAFYDRLHNFKYHTGNTKSVMSSESTQKASNVSRYAVF